MQFSVSGGDLCFEIPDEWWHFAEMQRFSAQMDYFPHQPTDKATIQIIEIDKVQPPRRSSGVVEFKRYKLMPVLFAFASPECALPPIEVVVASPNLPYAFKVKNGFHRFYASCAAGYRYLPVVQVG